MKTLTLEIEDKEFKFVNDLIRHFSFITIRENEPDEDTDAEVIANIREGVRQMRLVEQGKMKTTPFEEFLAELDAL